MKDYNHKEIEKKWQKSWSDSNLYKVVDNLEGKENFYTLVEFTYPSGNLHVGHWYAFAVPDIFSRYKRMQGYNVLYPMGFDAFGLPAENAAIKYGADPKSWTYEQMDKMRQQFYSMGAMFDWSREIVSCSPEYYKWTQWMFNKFLENDLVYRETTKVNWCPKDQTILANEQVIDGKCERCGTEVEQRSQKQWMLRITKYADRLIDDLDFLPWPEAIKDSQKNWIGRSEGVKISFGVKGLEDIKIKVFTTRVDTIRGVTYLALAPEHPVVQQLIEKTANKLEIEKYISNTLKKTEMDRKQLKEKTGIRVGSIMAINPFTNEEVEIWIADYVLVGYGTGAVMGVPQHDDRDREFAIAHNLPIVDMPMTDIEEVLEKTDSKKTNTYRIRDWGISRQRYWGTPIPIVYDPEGNAHPVPDEHLPWLLPTDVDHTPDGTPPLARSKELFERTEKIFGKGWKPEVETMDTFVDSTWYFYRYIDNKNDQYFADLQKRKNWMPIELYMGGPEHTTMHLLYSRFWIKALNDLGIVEENEVFISRRNRGLILGTDGNKMSKSKGNVINPDEIVDLLGADTVRMYLAFMGPYGVTASYPWDKNGVVGVRRFLERIWKMKDKIGNGKVSMQLHQCIKKMTEDIEEYKFNTAISEMMTLLNEWDKLGKILIEEYKTLLLLLAPFAPHITEEIWHEIGEKESIHLEKWPIANEAVLTNEIKIIPIQINGKVRSRVQVKSNSTKEEIQNIALNDSRIVEIIKDRKIDKIIVVPDRIINIVLP